MKRLTCAIAAGMSLLMALSPSADAEGLRLLQQRAAMLRIEYVPERDGAGGCAGKAVVGIPPRGQLSMTVIEATPAPSSSAPGVDGCDRLPGGQAAAVGSSGWLRDQRVAEVRFANYGPDGSPYARIVVDLHLPVATASTPGFRGSPLAESFYAGTLLNYQQARGWRRGSIPGAPRSLVAAAAPLVRLSLTQTGIYQVSGADLEAVGVDLDDLPTAGIALLYGGGRALPQSMDTTRDRALRPVRILVDGGDDGRFDTGDSFLFYGEGLDRWIHDSSSGGWRYIRNPYSSTNIYWLALGSDASARGVEQSSLADAPASIVEKYLARQHEEGETSTIDVADGNIQSGLEWYWEDLRAGDSRTFPLLLRQPADGQTSIRMRFVARSESARSLNISWNGRRVGTARFETEGAHLFEFDVDEAPADGLNELTIDSVTGDSGLLDWFELEFERRLEANREELFFGVPAGAGVVEYQLSGFSAPPRIFDITDGLDEIVGFAHDAATGQVVFRARADASRQYAAFASHRLKKPVAIELVDPSDLGRTGNRGADYVIVSHADFLDQAERLAAWRGADDRFGPPPTTAVIDVQEIYDVFSGGLFDPSAIRDFIAHTTTAWDPVPMFVVLLGDGSYDYRNNSATSSGNWIPPFEDGDLTSDDWYVCVIGDDQLADMAIGRLPVQTPADARTVVDKLIDYGADPEFGTWQSRVLLVADDTYNADDWGLIETMFVTDAEDLKARFFSASVEVEKLYTFEFPLEGRFKPEARDAFVDRFSAGAVLMVYIGHGNSRVFAHEHIFVLSTDLQAIANGRRLPFLYAAASQMGVFDDPLRDSIPEALLKWSNGGVVGMIGATRVGFHKTNMRLAHSFHQTMFRPGSEPVPVGIGLMTAKTIVDADRRKVLRYNLFGDPLTRLAIPGLAVRMEIADTLRALGETTLRGEVVDEEGNLMSDFSGNVRVQVFDSTTRAVNSERVDLEYERMGAPIFRGLLAVDRGRFDTTFRVPKDITYGAGAGRMTAYAWDGQVAAFGSAGPFALAGTDESAPADMEGPRIQFILDDKVVEDGRLPEVAPAARLEVRIRDASGINITGEVGHGIELLIDGVSTDVTGRYESLADYREGHLQVELNLEPGKHALQLEAWDTYNNWGASRIELRVSDAVGPLRDVLFHPNPLEAEAGHFTFVLSQAPAAVRVRVFSIAGRLVDELSGTGAHGYNQMSWRPAQELANGTYLFEVAADIAGAGSARRRGIIQIVR